MEIKAKLKKPYNEKEKLNFIVQQNHKLGYEIKETGTALEAWGYTQEEIETREKERIAKLSLTRGDVFRALYQARQVTRTQIRALIENNKLISQAQRELALIDFDEALNFYRGNTLIDTLGLALGITSEQLDEFFETNDFTCLMEVVEPTETPSEEAEETTINAPNDPQENQDIIES